MENRSHSVGIIPLTFARLFESFAYVGMRSIILVFMMRSALQMAPVEASRIYGIFAGLAVLLPVLGGLIGDLLLGNKLATIIGGFLQALGCFIITVPSVPFLYIGLLIVAIGTGLFNPNILAQLKIIYTSRKKATESAIQILYIGVNLGSFVGGFLFSIFSGKDFFTAGFIISGCLFCIPPILMLSTHKLTPELSYSSNLRVIEPERTTPGKNTTPLVLLFIIVPFFWLIYSSTSSEVWKLTYQTLSDHSSGYGFSSSISQLIFSMYPCFMILLGILFSILFFFTGISPLVKMGIGFLVYAIVCCLTTLISIPGSNNLMGALAIIIFLECLAELLISPVALAFICNTLPRRFCGTFIGLYLTVTGGLMLLNVFIQQFSEFAGKEIILFSSAGLCVLLAILFLVLHFVLRPAKPQKIQQDDFSQFQ